MKTYKDLLDSDFLKDAIMQVVEGKVKEDNTNDKSDDGEGLDKVQPKELKKKFKDRKDKDIDNDGDVDDSDKFIDKKRKAISKAIDAKEDVDKADETPAGDDTEDEAPKKKKKKKTDGEKDTPTAKDTGDEVVDTDPKLDESKNDDEPMDDDERKKIVSTFFKGLKKEDYAKYGKRAEAVMQKVAEKLADKEYK
jgi:hypothetical protein